MIGIGMIVAMTRNGIIGVNGKIPWNHKGDQARFKRLTMGCAVIMGRKTWDSIPEHRRPLEGRANIIMSNNPIRIVRLASWTPKEVWVAQCSVEKILSEFKDASLGNVWIIGGASVYEAAMPFIDVIDVTYVPSDVGVMWGNERMLPGKCENNESRCLACDRHGSHLEKATWTLFPTIDETVFSGGPEEEHPDNPLLRVRRFERIKR